MGNRISDWLQSEPVPRDLHARVMGDPRLAAKPAGHLRPLLAVATAALVVLVVGGGLGSILLRSNRPAGITAVTGSPSPAVWPLLSPSPSPGQSAPVTAPSPRASAGPGKCKTADLAISLGQGQGAAGTIHQQVEVVNRGAVCTVQGYFGMALLDGVGRKIAPDPVRRDDTQGAFKLSPILLAPGSGAHFDFAWSDVTVTDAKGNQVPCTVISQLAMTAPDQYDHQVIPANSGFGNHGMIATCGGSTEVTPLVAGSVPG